ncbi:MAG: exosporium glycoprotein BclB-related protein [Bacilli bacterium]|nr:exosporium glycoprotein BclB-related protein [Bacilli bacterium]
MTVAEDENLRRSSTIAFNGFQNGIIVLNGTISFLLNLQTTSFSMPRNGTITSLAAYFTNTEIIGEAGSTIEITAQLYQSTTPDNNFTAIPESLITLAPVINMPLAQGENFHGIVTNMNANVAAETRLLLVFTATVTDGVQLSTSITGYAGGGLTIA